MSKKRTLSSDDALVALHRRSHLSQRALENTLVFVRDHGLPGKLSRSSQTRARQKACQVLTPYGPVVQCLRVGELGVWINHPVPHLYRTILECEEFASLMSLTLRQYPSTPLHLWRIVLYFDEVTPTDTTNTHVDDHKLQDIYWTFLEFGHRIYDERVWFVLTAMPSVDVKTLPGKMSQLVGCLLADTFSTKVQRPSTNQAFSYNAGALMCAFSPSTTSRSLTSILS